MGDVGQGVQSFSCAGWIYCNSAAIVNKILCLSFVESIDLKCYYFKKEEKGTCEVMAMIISLTVVIISQYIHISNHQVCNYIYVYYV